MVFNGWEVEKLKKYELSQLMCCLDLIRSMYESIRLVDPVNSNVININNNTADTKERLKCFTLWDSNTKCKNCISMRAYIENKTFIKIEYSTDKIFLTTSVPVELEKERAVIEFIQDATESLFFENRSSGDSGEIYSMLENMNNLALIDALTGIYNRRYINEKLPAELRSSISSERLLSVIMLDVDHYKMVNDTYGHLAGDTVLKTLAETLQACIRRETDWIARFGGEEFFICLPGSPIHKSVEIAENMRRAIESKIIPCGNHDIKVTASFGVSSKKYSKGTNYEDVIEVVDKLLYKAKKKGRNRVEW